MLAPCRLQRVEGLKPVAVIVLLLGEIHVRIHGKKMQRIFAARGCESIVCRAAQWRTKSADSKNQNGTEQPQGHRCRDYSRKSAVYRLLCRIVETVLRTRGPRQ